jgi:hypothetical protein
MVTPGTTVTEAPSHTRRPITTGAGVMSARRLGSTAWFRVVRSFAQFGRPGRRIRALVQ